MVTRALKRVCPRCGNAAHVSRSIVANATKEVVCRLQEIRCIGCGLLGTVDVTEKIVWSDFATDSQECTTLQPTKK